MRLLYTNGNCNKFLISGTKDKMLLFEGSALKIKENKEINQEEFIQISENQFNKNRYMRKNLSDKILSFLQRLHFGFLQAQDKGTKIELLRKIIYLEKLYKEMDFKIQYHEEEKFYHTYKIALR